MQSDADFLAADPKLLTLHQRLATSGARAAHVFGLDGELYLAVPQLSEDIEGQAAHMNAGNSDIDAPIFRWSEGRFVDDTQLPCPAGEDAQIFHRNGETYLAFANLRTGSGPYEANTNSLIYRRDAGGWTLAHEIPTYGAKQWHYFSFDGRDFLALAQGLTVPHYQPLGHGRSAILEWKADAWQEIQILGGRWGYNWQYFEVGAHRFLAYADHVGPSLVYRWDGTSFIPYQSFAEKSGRAFRHFVHEGEDWLAFAAIDGASTLYRWNGELFIEHQPLGGAGGREYELIESEHGLFLVRVCFIEGSPQAPKTDLISQIFKWQDGKFELVEEFPTFGATDASFFRADGKDYLAVSNSLTPDVRFRQDMVIYQLQLDRA
jgi:hypothetical protein